MKKLSISLGTLIIILILVACKPTGTLEPTDEVQIQEATEQIQGAEETEATIPVEEVEPVTLRVGTTLDLDCLNPFACSWWWWYEWIIYEGFTLVGADCQLDPGVAESSEFSDDGLTLTLHLREGVTFTDSKPFDAYAVEAHWDWFTTVEPGDWYNPSLYSVSWEALDEYTFRLVVSDKALDMVVVPDPGKPETVTHRFSIQPSLCLLILGLFTYSILHFLLVF